MRTILDLQHTHRDGPPPRAQTSTSSANNRLSSHDQISDTNRDSHVLRDGAIESHPHRVPVGSHTPRDANLKVGRVAGAAHCVQP